MANEALVSALRNAKDIVFFGGAGVSTESGILDFRSVDGLYHQKWKYPPETILSHTFFTRCPEEFYRFYREKLLCPDAQPSGAHIALKKLEEMGKLGAIVTQNIDGLHQKAGSKCVYELHGSVMRNTCMKCHKKYTMEDILHSAGVPKCDCGGIIKPDVVLYEESLDEQVLHASVRAIAQCDLMIIGGTSLTVYPAAGLVDYCSGKIIVMNKTPTPRDNMAERVITTPVGQTLLEAVEAL